MKAASLALLLVAGPMLMQGQKADWDALDQQIEQLYLKGDLPGAVRVAKLALDAASSPKQTGRSLDRLGFLYYNSGNLKDGEQVIGARTKIKVVKNKIAAPANYCEVDLLFDRGFSKEGDLVDLCTENGIVDRAGAWYSHHGQRLGQGRDSVVNMLREDEGLRNMLRAQLMGKLCSKD